MLLLLPCKCRFCLDALSDTMSSMWLHHFSTFHKLSFKLGIIYLLSTFSENHEYCRIERLFLSLNQLIKSSLIDFRIIFLFISFLSINKEYYSNSTILYLEGEGKKGTQFNGKRRNWFEKSRPFRHNWNNIACRITMLVQGTYIGVYYNTI